MLATFLKKQKIHVNVKHSQKLLWRLHLEEKKGVYLAFANLNHEQKKFKYVNLPDKLTWWATQNLLIYTEINKTYWFTTKLTEIVHFWTKARLFSCIKKILFDATQKSKVQYWHR